MYDPDPDCGCHCCGCLDGLHCRTRDGIAMNCSLADDAK